MTNWLFPYDSKKFKLDECLEEFGFVEWHQLNKFKIGDILYFYATAPVRRITHKMKVVKINIEPTQGIDDSKYLTDLYDIKLKSDPKTFRVECVKKFKTLKLHVDELGKHGLKTKRIPPQKLTGDLLAYIEQTVSVTE